MKRICLIGTLWVLAQASQAQDQANPAASPTPTPTPASSPAAPVPPVSLEEAAGMAITQQWADKSYAAMEQAPGPDGAVQFRYGEAMPTISCAVLEVTDIELQPGEVVNEVKAGDSERWLIEPAVSGDVTKTEHVVVKPREPNLGTSLIITTDRRTYHLRVVSRDSGYMAHVSFLYKDEPVKAAEAPANAPREAPRGETPRPGGGGREARVALEELVRRGRPAPSAEGKAVIKVQAHPQSAVEGDGYRISGNAPWRPVRVYNDGTKTYIEMPANLKEAPVPFALRKGGFLGLGQSLALLNYRYHGHWYVLDGVPDKAVLVNGVGPSAEKIVISRAK
jgi:type IV secretory pathway VirB9-like protein